MGAVLGGVVGGVAEELSVTKWTNKLGKLMRLSQELVKRVVRVFN
jgi:hypothetical protein